MKVKNAFLLATLFLWVQALSAKVVLPALVGDNMVLQQQSRVNLWGKTETAKTVIVKTSWDNRSYTVRTDKDGNWKVKVQTPVAGGPYEIIFNDGEVVRLKNVLIGEVWFCSGQSNMEMPMKGFDRQPVEGALDMILKAKETIPIRVFTVKHDCSTIPLDDCSGAWNTHTPENVAKASATAYFFAHYLNSILEVPVGIIVADWGGSKIQPWMPEETIRPYEKNLSHLGNTNVEKRDLHDKACTLYNAMVAPLTPYGIKGMLWYQGESNRTQADLYEELFPAFVSGMRGKFECGDFPFYYVQIAPFRYDGSNKKSAARFREVQAEAMNRIPNCGMAVTLDIGEENGIHPHKKAEVGKRLAYWALAKTYGKNPFSCSGPVYKSMQVEGRKVYLSFDHAPEGVAPLETPLEGFEVAGSDRKFYPAHAIVEAAKGMLSVSSDKVEKPVAVRYGYRNFIKGSLFDVYGNPASSFRTDDWEMTDTEVEVQQSKSKPVAVQRPYFERELPIRVKKESYAPSIRVYLPDKKLATGRVVISCPGGAYGHLAIGHEGYDWAPFYNERGIALVVLKYRMPEGNREIPFSDLKAAIKMTRDSAAVWHINSHDVGVMGFSAGGHLASTAATHFSGKYRPDFQILFYPIITLEMNRTNRATRENLLGAEASEKVVTEFSNEKQVTPRTPRAFIGYSIDDGPAGTDDYYAALQQLDIPAEMHVYPSGGHGWGMKEGFPHRKQMMDELTTWLQSF